VQYSTGTSNIIGRIVADVVVGSDVAGAEREAAMRAFMRDELLEPLGIDEATIDPQFDAAGNVNAGSAINATARTFAKLGYLYLRGGEWDGRRIVPRSWVDYSRTQLPAPAGFGEYGAQWWVEEQEPSIFRMGGFGGQHVVVVPDKDLVVVVLSDRLDGKDGDIRDRLRDAFDNVTP
jgi:CubicO group peptidase (beta-lactamase class C family)